MVRNKGFSWTFLLLFLAFEAGSTEKVKEIVTIEILEVQIPSNQSAIPTNETRESRQIAEKDNIDVEGPYGYIPRVVHGVNKIVKGLLNGSVHEVFHGAFGIAPEDVAEDLVGTYNRIMGIPDPEDVDEEATPKPKRKQPTKKTTPKPKSKFTSSLNGTRLSLGTIDVGNGAAAKDVINVKGKKKQPSADYEGNDDEEEANEEEDGEEEEDDD